MNGPSSLQETVLPTVLLRDLLQRIVDGNLLTITNLFKMSLKELCQQFTLYQSHRKTEQVSFLGAEEAQPQVDGSGWRVVPSLWEPPLGSTAPWPSFLHGVSGPRLGRYPPSGCVSWSPCWFSCPISGLTTERGVGRGLKRGALGAGVNEPGSQLPRTPAFPGKAVLTLVPWCLHE